ncbi:hypothetical protein FRB91_006354 [Serendipita sp. 411]|nr:hypothetical protein FRC18_005145 [Serendipita sp. 400]KAG8852569.1 hypothetical protein FRB91_006354 [Serendipita sp. 411]
MAKLLQLFPQSVLNELVSLNVKFSSQSQREKGVPAGAEYGPMRLPELEELTENGAWYGLIRTKAPNLRRLYLHGCKGKPEYLVQTELDPIFLEIECHRDAKALDMLFSQARFPNVIDFHVCIVYHQWHEDFRLLQYLAFDQGLRLSESFPKLRTLIVDVTRLNKGGLNESGKRKMSMALDRSTLMNDAENEGNSVPC